MTESNTNGSTRNVIDAFVSAQENRQRVVQDSAAQNVTTQNVALQSESSQSVNAPNEANQSAVAKKELAQKRKSVWKILIPAVTVVIVGVVITVVAISWPQGDDGNMVSLPDKIEGYNGSIADSTAAALLSKQIRKKVDDDNNYSYDDALRNYEKIYNEVDEDMRIYVLIEYADFVYNKTHDLNSAINILERLETSLMGGAALDAYCWKLDDWYYLRDNVEKSNYHSNICTDVINRADEEISIPIEITGGSQEDEDE